VEGRGLEEDEGVGSGTEVLGIRYRRGVYDGCSMMENVKCMYDGKCMMDALRSAGLSAYNRLADKS